MGRPAVLDDAESSGGDLFLDPEIQEDHTVRNIFLEAVARQGLFPAFPRDHGRHPLISQPLEQPAKLGPQDGGVGESRKEDFDRIQHNPFRADRVDRVGKADEKSLQVVFPGFLYFAPDDVDMVHGHEAAADHAIDVDPEGKKIFG